MIKRKIGSVLYYMIGRKLPPSYSGIKIGQKAFRQLCGRLMLASCGKDVNIEKNAFFLRRLNWEIILE